MNCLIVCIPRHNWWRGHFVTLIEICAHLIRSISGSLSSLPSCKANARQRHAYMHSCIQAQLQALMQGKVANGIFFFYVVRIMRKLFSTSRWLPNKGGLMDICRWAPCITVSGLGNVYFCKTYWLMWQIWYVDRPVFFSCNPCWMKWNVLQLNPDGIRIWSSTDALTTELLETLWWARVKCGYLTRAASRSHRVKYRLTA